MDWALYWVLQKIFVKYVSVYTLKLGINAALGYLVQ